MNNQISIFKNPQLGQIRTSKDENDEPLFCLSDLCKILGLRAPDVKRRLDDDVVSTHSVRDSKGRKNLMTFVNEDGLYDVVLDSRKANARAFRKWVTSEVLPQIRRTGGYIPVHEGESAESTLARAVEIYESTIAMKNQQIEALQPKAEYCDEVLKSVSAFPVRVVAHTLGMTAQELNRFLCEHGVQYGQSGSYVPYAMYAKKGYTKSRTYLRYLADGNVTTEHRTKWTEPGIRFITEMVGELRKSASPQVKMIQLTFDFG